MVGKVISLVVLAFVVVTSLGCTSNGSHMYVDGKCISCWNNPLTKETIDYESAGAHNYQVLTWHEMMLEGLARSPRVDLQPFGRDYLRHKIRSKENALRQNEIAYRRAVNKSVIELENALFEHRLKPAYQITQFAKLGKYDFDQGKFPLRLPENIKLSGGNTISTLPRYITASVSNFSDWPDLTMGVDEAESFLNDRNNSHSMYVRYVVEVTEMVSPKAFHVRVNEIQFIDLVPTIVTIENKEKHQPFRSIKL